MAQRLWDVVSNVQMIQQQQQQQQAFLFCNIPVRHQHPEVLSNWQKQINNIKSKTKTIDQAKDQQHSSPHHLNWGFQNHYKAWKLNTSKVPPTRIETPAWLVQRLMKYTIIWLSHLTIPAARRAATMADFRTGKLIALPTMLPFWNRLSFFGHFTFLNPCNSSNSRRVTNLSCEHDEQKSI